MSVEHASKRPSRIFSRRPPPAVPGASSGSATIPPLSPLRFGSGSLFVGCVAVALQLGMADPGELLRVQGLQIGGVAAVVSTGLLIINFLDHPYAPHIGGIQPSAIRRALVMARNIEPGLRPACNASGRPV